MVGEWKVEHRDKLMNNLEGEDGEGKENIRKECVGVYAVAETEAEITGSRLTGCCYCWGKKRERERGGEEGEGQQEFIDFGILVGDEGWIEGGHCS
jgi:hypothetical protein